MVTVRSNLGFPACLALTIGLRLLRTRHRPQVSTVGKRSRSRQRRDNLSARTHPPGNKGNHSPGPLGKFCENRREYGGQQTVSCI